MRLLTTPAPRQSFRLASLRFQARSAMQLAIGLKSSGEMTTL